MPSSAWAATTAVRSRLKPRTPACRGGPRRKLFFRPDLSGVLRNPEGIRSATPATTRRSGRKLANRRRPLGPASQTDCGAWGCVFEPTPEHNRGKQNSLQFADRKALANGCGRLDRDFKGNISGDRNLLKKETGCGRGASQLPLPPGSFLHLKMLNRLLFFTGPPSTVRSCYKWQNP